MSIVGDILSTVGCSVPWDDIMSTMEDILSSVGGTQYRGGSQITKDCPHGTEHPYGTHDIPHMHHDVPLHAS